MERELRLLLLLLILKRGAFIALAAATATVLLSFGLDRQTRLNRNRYFCRFPVIIEIEN